MNRQAELEEAKKLIKWVADYFERTPGLERVAGRGDDTHIMGKMHVVINAYQTKEKYVECNARVHHENIALKTANETLLKRIEELGNRLKAAANELGNMPHHEECEKWLGYPHKCDCGVDDLRAILAEQAERKAQ